MEENVCEILVEKSSPSKVWSGSNLSPIDLITLLFSYILSLSVISTYRDTNLSNFLLWDAYSEPMKIGVWYILVFAFMPYISTIRRIKEVNKK